MSVNMGKSSNFTKRTLPKIKTQLAWKSEFSFLEFSIKENHMFCKICLKFEDNIKSCKNFNPSFITGCSNFRKSAISEHSKTDMHMTAANLNEKEKAEMAGQKYINKFVSRRDTPIGESIKKMGTLPPEHQNKLEKLFHVAYYIAKRGHPYTDFTHELELQKLHNVVFLDTESYENESACRDFINVCSKSILEEQVKEKLHRSNFFSILCDGSTDSAVIEKECIYVLFVDPIKFRPTLAFFSLRNVPSQDAEGVFSAIKKAFLDEGLENFLQKLVFLASDGASVNTGVKNGLISIIRKETPWVGFIWCFAHRLELALKDALKKWMDPITSSLQNLYYLYEKSSKKLRELKDLHELLKEIYEYDDARVKPHRATGTRWITHKMEALGNMLDKYGLYMQHFENIISDTTKKTDKATLEGKRRQLQKAEVVLFGAVFYDLLEPARELSLVTQREDANLIKVVDSIESTRKRYQRLYERVEKDPDTILQLPRVKSLLSKVTLSDFFNAKSSAITTTKYQDVVLLHFTQAKQSLLANVPKILLSVCDCFDQRYGNLTSVDASEISVQESITQSDVLLHHICKVLNTSSWNIPKGVKSSTALEKPCESIEHIWNQFKELISEQSIDELKEQYLQVVEFCIEYYKIEIFEPLDLWSVLYNNIGHRFPSIFKFVELCLCAPYSNATVERFFNYMKIVKTDWRSKLNERNLESLLRIKVEGPELKEFAENFCHKAVLMWWNEKERRINQAKRKQYKERSRKQKRPRFTNNYIDEFLGELSSSDSDDNGNARNDIEFDVE